MSPRTLLVPRTTRRAAATALAAVTLLAAAPLLAGGPALADPKPGSSGRIYGPAAPKAAKSVKKSATASKSSSASRSASKSVALAGWGMGARGDKVVALQERLIELKYDVDTADGQFGDQTQQAIMAFQKVNGLARTGRVTDALTRALAAATDPEPLIADGGKDRVEVDLKRQALFLYLDGQLDRILSISSGSGKDFCVTDPETGKTACDKAVTPGGSYRIRGRIIGWRESKLGLLYNPLYFNGGIAIHGAPSVPGYPASHGCVRIPMQAAEWFHTVVKDGTPVYVFGAEKAPVPLGEKLPPAATSPTTTAPGSDALLTPPTSTTPTSSIATTPTTAAAGEPVPTTAPAAPTTPAPAPTLVAPAPGNTTTAVGTPLATTIVPVITTTTRPA